MTVADTGLPRRVLKHLFVAHRIPIGGRFLDVGCGAPPLIDFAHQLGLDAEGLVCGVDPALRAAAQRHPDVHHVDSLQHGVPVAQHSVDLILVRDLSLYQGSLNQSPALDITAQLLACVRPGGHLVLLLPDAYHTEERHVDACFVRHLAVFPGSVGLEVLQGSRWSWPFGRHAESNRQFSMSTLATPREPVSLASWRAAGHRAAAAGNVTCCSRVAERIPCQPVAEAA